MTRHHSKSGFFCLFVNFIGVNARHLEFWGANWGFSFELNVIVLSVGTEAFVDEST